MDAPNKKQKTSELKEEYAQDLLNEDNTNLLIEEDRQYLDTISSKTREKVEERIESDDVDRVLDNLYSFSVSQTNLIDPNTEYFKGQLKLFQKEGLTWMLSRENYIRAPFFNQPKNWVSKSDTKSYFNSQTEVEVVSNLPPVSGEVVLKTVENTNAIKGGILADEMGLGKTVQMLSLICTNMPPNSKSFSTLIVCPNSLLLQWGEEAERFTDTFGIHLQHGKERIMDNAQMISLAKGKTIVITSYTTLSKDVANGYYKGVSFLRIVLDEAHEIRNFRGAADKRSRFLERINSIKAEFRWAMTGTPIQNSYGDLFALFKFLRVRPFGEYNAWYRMIEIPLTQPSKHLHEEGLRLLQRLTSTLILRRTKGQASLDIQAKNRVEVGAFVKMGGRLYVVKSLSIFYFIAVDKQTNEDIKIKYNANYSLLNVLVPLPRRIVHEPIKVVLSSRERNAYDRLIEENIRNFTDSKGNLVEAKIKSALEFILRLRQASTHPFLSDAKLFDKMVKGEIPYQTSSKLTKLYEVIANILQKDPLAKILVFSLYTKTLKLIEFELQTKGWVSCFQKEKAKVAQNVFCKIDGSMNVKRRQTVMTVFKTISSVKILLCSLRATAVGLNLVEANHVIFVDLDYNPQIHAQAIDRAHRIGQEREVTVDFILADNTVDEKIWNLMEHKRGIASSSFKQTNFGKHSVLELIK